MRGLMMMAPQALPLVFDETHRSLLAELLEIDPSTSVTSLDDVPFEVLNNVEVLVTGWGVPYIGPAELDRMPKLQAIVHWGGGGTFVDPAVVDRGVALSSARAINAIPVAEFTVAMIVLAAKEAFWISRRYGSEQRPIDREAELSQAGMYGKTVGVVGASTIGELVIGMLRQYDVRVVVYDPFATADAIAGLGAELVGDLADLARCSDILSIHAPDVPATRGMISREVLSLLHDDATVINTARGALVDQDALIDELRQGRLHAVLDVTEPEVLPAGHPLYALPNVFLTPHLAGSMGTELRRLGAFATDEVARLVAGQPFLHPIAP